VATSKETNLWITQIDGSVIEESGVIKMDFLGLKTLSILKTALELIRENHGIDINPDDLPLDDEKTYQLYQRGETNGTFQFESPGMQKYLRELKPDQFGDLIAMNALYRPGPIAYIPNFINRKHGRETISYDLGDMEEYLSETYGITVYQEQVMLLSQKLAGFSKGDADVLRKAMGKKQIAVLDKMKSQFISGATAKGHPEEKLQKVWTDWEAFAQYAFNKSHSTCYAFVAYQTAYLKAHYPSEYMAAVLNHASDIDKITFFMEECKRMGLKVLGPDVNESKKGFAVNKKGEIRFGLGGLKGVGEAAIENLVEEREKGGPFKDVIDFIRRVNQRTVNKRSIESLIFSGAFDCFPEYHRGQYFFIPKGEMINGIEKIIKYGNSLQQQAASTLNTLFGNLNDSVNLQPPKLPNCEPWTLTELLNHEKEVTGMFMSGHPLDHFKFEMKYYGIIPIAEYNKLAEDPGAMSSPGRTIKLAGLVINAQQRVTKTGKNFASFSIEDYSGKAEFMVWSNDYARLNNYLVNGMTVYISGNFKARMRYTGDNRELTQDGWEFKIGSMQLLESLKTQSTKGLEIVMHPADLSVELLQMLEKNFNKNKGTTWVKFKLRDSVKNYDIELDMMNKPISINEEMADYLFKTQVMDVKVITAE
jgi:DNA polymerase-3 subunit alpha